MDNKSSNDMIENIVLMFGNNNPNFLKKELINLKEKVVEENEWL